MVGCWSYECTPEPLSMQSGEGVSNSTPCFYPPPCGIVARAGRSARLCEPTAQKSPRGPQLSDFGGGILRQGPKVGLAAAQCKLAEACPTSLFDDQYMMR